MKINGLNIEFCCQTLLLHLFSASNTLIWGWEKIKDTDAVRPIIQIAVGADSNREINYCPYCGEEIVFGLKEANYGKQSGT